MARSHARPGRREARVAAMATVVTFTLPFSVTFTVAAEAA